MLLVHNPSTRDKTLTRSQTARRQISNQDNLSQKQTDYNIVSLDDENDPPDKNNSDDKDKKQGNTEKEINI